MKKLAFAIATVALVALSSCSGSGKAPAAAGSDSAGFAAADGTAPALDIRYIDGDSVSARYTLAKEFHDQYLRTLSKMQQTEKAKSDEINKFGSQIEQKMRSNGYLSQDSYEADMQRLQRMQSEGQNALATMQRNAEQELMRQQQELNDSIDSFIKDYVATHPCSAILYKAAGVYFDPALDITDEVVAGLNARYEKSKNSTK